MPPEHPELSAVRRRGVRLIVWAAWTAATAFLLVAGNAALALLERWVRALEALRRTAGYAAPLSGPDWFLAGGVLLAVAAPCALLAVAYARYRAAWQRRLAEVWASPRDQRRYCRPRLPRPKAEGRELAARCAWLDALAATPPWRDRIAPAAGFAQPSERYRRTAERFLAAMEPDIARRATVTGLVVGIGSSRALDLATIAFAALELQLHVLGALGKRPSLRMWARLWRNTAASLFVNTYLNREETCALVLTVKKVGLGLEAGAGAAGEAFEAMTELVGDTAADAGGIVSLAGPVVSVGTSGVRHAGRMVDRYSEELIQGILAGGILYYHGMGIAADCLALDQAHRETPEMRPSVRHAARNVCAHAAGMVRAQARELRAAIRGRVRRPAAAAAHAATEGAARAWNRLRRGLGRKAPGVQDAEETK